MSLALATTYAIKHATAGAKDITYLYDGFGNLVRTITTESGQPTQTQIFIGSGGSVSAHYTFVGESRTLNWPIYGMGRIGICRDEDDGINGEIYHRNIGKREYEVTDQVGSVRGLISDIKLPPGEGQDGFQPDVLMLADYDNYGMLRPNRTYSLLNHTYEYGFQGMRRMVQGDRSSVYTTLFRTYDAATGAWTSHDPIMHEWESPYAGLGGMPNMLVDPLGLQEGGAKSSKADVPAGNGDLVLNRTLNSGDPAASDAPALGSAAPPDAFFVIGTDQNRDRENGEGTWTGHPTLQRTLSGIVGVALDLEKPNVDYSFSYHSKEAQGLDNSTFHGPEDRGKAAKELATHVKAKRDPNKPITLIGYSHGGNVIIQTVAILRAELGDKIRINILMLSTPVSQDHSFFTQFALSF